ncbi:hypothetical protein GBA65_22040 (plasmid) [Rubrobacter marinus]|uniref:Uncharacterized protein n=1 Tax=Rubrobacter marinus TaxID=2653852 RepID=A0A6G8Q475_9ACTN|nr:hypothetical protein [Rubrobacter marinus]QIN81117.1 hypothetical protein GBA65_22040 [Rubrobacter marinus]
MDVRLRGSFLLGARSGIGRIVLVRAATTDVARVEAVVRLGGGGGIVAATESGEVGGPGRPIPRVELPPLGAGEQEEANDQER